MSEQIVQVADASPSTKNMRTIQQAAGGNTVQSEVVILATGAANGGDTYDARQIRTLATSDVVTAVLQAKVGSGPAALTGTTAGASTGLDVNVINIVQGTVSVKGSQAQLLQQDSANNNALMVTQRFGAASIDPRAIRTLTSTDNVTVNGSVLALQQDAGLNLQVSLWNGTNEAAINASGQVSVTQNLLGANDKPDVTVNQSGTLKTSNANIPLLATDSQNNLLVKQPVFQAVKGGWGPGWGEINAWG